MFLSVYDSTLPIRQSAIDQLLWQVESLLGPLSKQNSIVQEGDNDRAILRQNFQCILDKLVSQVMHMEKISGTHS